MAWDTASKPNNLFRRSRWQLTVWYSGVMAVVLGLSGLGVYEAIAHAHRVTADRELKSVADTVHDVLEQNLNNQHEIGDLSPNLLPNLCVAGETCRAPFEINQGHHRNHLYQGSYYIRVLAPTGELIATAGFHPQTLPPSGTETGWQTLLDGQGNRYRQVTLPITALDNQTLLGTLLVGRSFNDFAAYLATIRWIIGLSLPVTMGLIALASWWLAGSALAPVQVAYRKIQQFTADAAHELRTPLAAVQATGESVMHLPEISDADAREMVQVISRQSKRLTHLVNDLLLLSRLDTQAPKLATRCCLQDLLSDIAEELAALALSNHIQLILQQPAKPLIFGQGNEAHLYRLVVNVVSNGLQHTPAGGKVTMALSQHDRQAWITVTDTGTGIAPVDQTQIFDRFYRVEKDRSRQSGGSGLGLAIAKAIAHAHGGDIGVQSHVGQGSTFTIQLPISG